MYPAPHEPTFRAAQGTPASLTDERVAFLRKVYLLMTGSVVMSGAAAAFACLSGAATLVTVGPGLAVPPMIAFFLSHWLLSFGLLMGGTFAASMVARKPGINVFALFALAAVIGLVIAPTIYFTQLRAHTGDTLSPQPVLMAFGVATAGFSGLSAYALITKRDFSFLRGFLTMGLFVVIGASILSLFFGGASFSLAIASVTVLLFGGFVLYDTSRILKAGETEAVPAALSLYLDFLNLFLALLRIFGSGRRD